MKRIESAFTWALVTACAIVLLAYAGASKAVTIRTDPTPGATHCGLYKGGTFDADYPVANVGAGNGCLFTIDAQVAGTTVVYTATAVYSDVVWGRVESPRSLPLSVARPATPAIPAWAATPVRAISASPVSRALPGQ